MATTTAVRASSHAPSIARPLPPHPDSANAGSSPSSPVLNKKPIPTPKPSAKPLSSLDNVNGVLPRTRPRPRPSQVKISDKNLGDGAHAAQRPKEPYVKDSNYIMRKCRGKPPSLILHLHPTYFRFDQQDGTFSYNSEMKTIIEHLKARTVPHDLIEELLQANVAFYDGCLIVEVHDHKTAATGNKDIPSSADDLRGLKAFNLHDNTNHYITPSPYAPYPEDRDIGSRPSSSKENVNGVPKDMQAPGKSAKKSNKPRIFTVVLHPTDLARHREIGLLTRTPWVDPKAANRRQSSISGRERPAPLSAIPPTPISASVNTPYVNKGAKRQRMCLEEGDIHFFEGEVLKAQNPSLLLDPAHDFVVSCALLDQLRHPLHDQKPSKKQSRKRTTAELAADEAQAAEEERIALIMDDRLQPSLSTADGKSSDFQPDFSRFKKFEDIKRNHEEEKNRKKEEEAVVQQNKRSDEEKRRQAQEAAARREQQIRNQQALEQQKSANQQRQAQMQHQQQQQHAQSPMHNPMLQQLMHQQQQQQASQGPQMSPVVGNLATSNSSPLVGNNMFANSMSGAAMAPTTSTQGPGSPPRPPSAMQAPQGMAPPMARQLSQQTSQPNLSRNSTPQIPHATPQMRNVTPQPQSNQMSNGVPQTPVMGQQQMNNPQLNAQRMHQMQQMQQQIPPQLQAQFMAARQSGNPQQMAHFHQALAAHRQMVARSHAQQQQQGQLGQNASQMQMQGSPQGNLFGGQMSPQANGMPQNQGQLQMPTNMGQNNSQVVQQRMQEYRRSLAQQAQNKLHNNPQPNGQASPQSPPQSMGPQFMGQMSSAGSPNGMTMAPAMNRNPSQFGNPQQSPHPQPQMTQMGPGGQQQPRPQNVQNQQQMQRMKQMYLQQLAQGNGGQLPPDADQRWMTYMRQRQAQAAQQRAQQAAGQASNGMMMPGQGLQAMQQGGMRPPGQMASMHGLNPFQQQQQQQAAMLKMQQQRQIAMQNQQGQNMMNGMGPGMMGGVNGAMNGGMSNGIGRPG